MKRYKRFLAHIQLEDGTLITAHCPNSGALLKAKEPGLKVWVSPVPEDIPRKLRYTWELVKLDESFVCINTYTPNRLVEEALLLKKIPEFQHVKKFRREVKYGASSRIDFFLETPEGFPWYLEVKSVHMKEGTCALFPDSVTERGAKQVRELLPLIASGAKATILYVIQRSDICAFDLARTIDPVYAQVMLEAHAQGLESLAYTCHVSPTTLEIKERVPIL